MQILCESILGEYVYCTVIVALIVIIIHIKQKRTVESQIKQSLTSIADLQDFVENGSVGLHCVGVDGTILWANQADWRTLGYTREEYIGHPITKFHADPEVIADILDRLKRFVKQINQHKRIVVKFCLSEVSDCKRQFKYDESTHFAKGSRS